MADEAKVEKVEYVYEGTVAPLRQATQKAISLLGQYEDAIKGMAASGRLDVSKTTFGGFKRAINSVIRQTNTLSKVLNKTSAQTQQALVPDTAVVVRAGKDIEDVLNYISTSSKLTKEDVELLTMTLRDTSSVFEHVSNKANALGTSLAKVGKLASNDAQTVATAAQAEATEMQHASKSAEESAQVFIEHFKKVEAAAARAKSKVAKHYASMAKRALAVDYAKQVDSGANLSGKSAYDSAKAFVQANQGVVTGAAGTNTVLGRLQTRLRQAQAQLSLLAGSMVQAAKANIPFASQLGAASKKAKQFSSSLISQRKAAKQSSGQNIKFLESVKQLKVGLSKVQQQTHSFTASLKRMHKGLVNVHSLMHLMLHMGISKFLSDATIGAIKFIENLNLFTVAMGKSVDQGLEFVSAMQEVYGMDPSNLYRYAGYFNQLTDAIGMTNEAATSISLSMTKASNDVASLFNVPIEDVVEDLASGMQGMTRAVRKYGMDIRTVTLAETARSIGLQGNVTTMSEANRMALRYITMMQQVDNALRQTTKTTDGASVVMGDFARNIETPANQLRIFKEQMSQLARAIGNFFIGPISVAIQYINGFVMALRTLLTFVASTLGILNNRVSTFSPDSTEKVAESVGAIGDAADSTSKKLKNLTAPIDELNILQENSGGGGGGGIAAPSDTLDPKLLETIEGMELHLENIRMKANQVRDSILEFLGFKVDAGQIISWDSSQFEKNLIDKFPQWTQTIQATFDSWGIITDGFGAVFQSLGNVIGIVAQKLVDFFSLFVNDDTVSTFIEGLGAGLQGLADWINEHSNALANLAILIAGVAGAFKLFHTIKPVVGILAGIGKAIGVVLSVMSPAIAIIAAVSGALLLLMVTHEDFANSVIDLVSTVWDDVLKPVLQKVGQAFATLWNDHLAPMFEELFDAVGNIVDAVLAIWNNVLEPLVSWFLSVLGPTIAGVIGGVVEVFTTLLGNVADIVADIISVIGGIADFVAGVFSGDWERAWEGVKEIFGGIWDTFVDIVKIPVNIVIGIINAVGEAIVGVFNSVKRIINSLQVHIPDWVPLFGDKTIGFNLRMSTFTPVPALANGGVVTGPTYLMAGEGRYDEAVIPLGNSPQMSAMVEQIAARVGNEQVVAALRELISEVHNKDTNAYLDGYQVSRHMREPNARVAREHGTSLIRRGVV